MAPKGQLDSSNMSDTMNLIVSSRRDSLYLNGFAPADAALRADRPFGPSHCCGPFAAHGCLAGGSFWSRQFLVRFPYPPRIGAYALPRDDPSWYTVCTIGTG